ncbi:MAG: hypothetical protein L0H70_04785, partial [Xanthomonadales bacterium]|nr:hypothetical protein [Xanthomonadales bacterium]
AKKDANGDVRAIILDNGPPNAAMMQRAGIHDGQWLAVKQQVATTITQLGGTAAVLDKSGHIATGAAGAFSVDLSTWVSAPPHASAVALVGFGDLEPASTRHDGSPPGPIKRGVCTIAHATVSGAGVCPAGKTQVAQFPHCGKLNQDPQSTTYVSYATDYGPLVLSQRVTKAWTSISQRCHVNFQGFIICPSHPVLSCGRNPNCYMPPHYHQFLSVVSTALVVKLNAATIDEQAACEKDTWALYDKNDTCTLGNTVWWDPAPPPRGEHRCALGPHFSQITGNDRLCCSQ